MRRESQRLEVVAICDLKDRARRSAISSDRVYGARGRHAFGRASTSDRRPGQRSYRESLRSSAPAAIAHKDLARRLDRLEGVVVGQGSEIGELFDALKRLIDEPLEAPKKIGFRT